MVFAVEFRAPALGVQSAWWRVSSSGPISSSLFREAGFRLRLKFAFVIEVRLRTSSILSKFEFQPLANNKYRLWNFISFELRTAIITFLL